MDAVVAAHAIIIEAKRGPESDSSTPPRHNQATGATHAGGFFIAGTYPDKQRSLSYATPKELSFILALQKRFSNAVGFLPKAAIEWYVDNRHCHLAYRNGQPAGYILGRASMRWNRQVTPITQAAVDFSEQRRSAGLSLVRRVEDAARQEGQSALQAMCRADLDANEFWQAAGFEEVARYLPASRRAQEIICWRKLLVPYRPSWFEDIPPRVGHKARSLVTAVQPTLFDYLRK